MSPVMSHHLTKLHKKALVAGTTSSLAQVSTIDYSWDLRFLTILPPTK